MNCRKCKKDIPDDSKFCMHCGMNQYPTRSKRMRGNGMGTVYKRGKTWRIEVTVGWKLDDTPTDADMSGGANIAKRIPIRKYKGGFATKKEASEYIPTFLKELEEKKSRGDVVVASNAPITLASLYRGWSTSYLPTLSKDKRKCYEIAYTKLENTDIVARNIKTVTIEDLQAAIDKMGTSHYTSKDMRTVLSQLYDRAVAQQVVAVNLSKYIIIPELVEKEGVPFSETEQQALWKCFADGLTFAGYILLMIYSGAMPGEVLKAEKNMINWDEQGILGAGLKTKKRQKTPIVVVDIMLPVLKSLCDYSTSEKLWPLGKDAFYERYYATLEVCGCRRLTPYSCRHTTGTALALNQIPDAIAQEIMRHANYQTTRKFYTHIDSSRSLEAANKAFAGNSTDSVTAAQLPQDTDSPINQDCSML